MIKNYKVYFLLNKSKTPIYCGLTRQPLSSRFNQHISIKKLNRLEHSISLVQDNLTIEEAVILEEMLIKQNNLRKDGLNISPKSINGYSNFHSDEQKEIWSSSRKGCKVSTEHAEKNRVARLGHSNSKEHTKKIVEKISKPIICIETGIVYKSARHAAKELGLQYSKISLVCNGKRNSTGNLHFKFYKTVETSRNN